MNKANRIFGLDILRAIAILSVLFFHFYFIKTTPLFSAFASKGWAGVDLFFVLSGFLVGNQILGTNKKESVLKQCLTFWIKRWTRTVPLYFIVLLFYVILKPVFFHAPFIGFNWKWLLFLQNLDKIQDFGQSWSLAIEEQFYFVFPILAFLLARFTSFVWLLPMAFSLFFRGYLSIKLQSEGIVHLSHMDYLWTFRFPSWVMLDAISVGVFLARTYGTWSLWKMGFKRMLGVFGGLLIVTTLMVIPEFPVEPFQITINYALLAIGFGLMLIYFESIKSRIRYMGFLQPIAIWSYSAYLLHMIIVRILDRYLVSLHFYFLLVIYIITVMFISFISYELIEKNGLKIRKRLLRS